VPAWVAEHGLEWAVAAAGLAIVAGILAWGDARYWLRNEEKVQAYKQALLDIDNEVKAEERQIRIWTNYNTATPESIMVPARNLNISASKLLVKDLEKERDRKVKEWESEN